ncbi:MAG: hypothetical protein KOO60_01375 [Gemmatimonadales bacterium]|nr:hypothetical protein [Gemmatimonadales bacterium]
MDIYWSTRSLEAWLKLPGNPEKAPDLAQAQIVDTHWLWENLQTSREHGKVADLVVMGTISKKHPREWLLLELGNKARSLGAHTVVINSLQVVGLVGQAHRDDEEALITKGLNVSVRVYAQTFRFE